jgi:1-acyl-sn-glycerol-3-phosphate acyltransferase
MSDLKMHAHTRPPPWGVRLGRFLAWLLGWKAVGGFPHVPKGLFIASPHTSLWDGPIMVILAWSMGIRLSFITKREMLRFPFKRFVTFFGGIGIDRSRRNDVVAQVAEAFRARDGMYLAVAPDGTRRALDHWKSGFYHMALAAGVPVICGYLDYEKKEGGFRHIFELTGDPRVDMERLREVYAGIPGKFPQLTSRVYLRAEDGVEAPAAR